MFMSSNGFGLASSNLVNVVITIVTIPNNDPKLGSVFFFFLPRKEDAMRLKHYFLLGIHDDG